MNVFEILSRNHRALVALLERAQSTSDRARKVRQELLHKLATTFEVHATAAEEGVYAALREHAALRDRCLAAAEEHALVRWLFDELSEVDPGDERWLPKLNLLKENLELHLAQEESELFARARRLIGKARQEELGATLEAALERLRSQQAPGYVRRRSPRERLASLWV